MESGKVLTGFKEILLTIALARARDKQSMHVESWCCTTVCHHEVLSRVLQKIAATKQWYNISALCGVCRKCWSLQQQSMLSLVFLAALYLGIEIDISQHATFWPCYILVLMLNVYMVQCSFMPVPVISHPSQGQQAAGSQRLTAGTGSKHRTAGSRQQLVVSSKICFKAIVVLTCPSAQD